ncbi:hypothetical protein CLV67_104193 [Actinoplanes italicus]|uniref:Uncharacterized protein n=1 Tax=Actinoplanes italicus TaxID=113567 RepID=A0A2T0KGU4_9ACTN|nr:hypothetical protein CLV67_104193 [Actinoplanes italicus]
MIGVPRNRLIRRQLALSLATLLVCLLTWGTTGMLAASGSVVAVTLAGLPMLLGIPAPILLWFRGEDELDVTARWITPIVAAAALLAVAATIAAPAAYHLSAAGDTLGWFAPGTTAPPPRLQRLALLTAAAGLTLLALVTALRVRRDLRRYDLTGSRRPPQRVRDSRERRRHEREQRIERLRARRRGDTSPSGTAGLT